jgi:Carboxypeptidase regulatory-like domain
MRWLAALACLGLLQPHAASAQVSSQTSPPANTAFRIAGTVLDAKSGSPLARARVRIADAQNAKNVQSAVSSDDGHFEFQVGAGKFSLQAARHGYITSAYDQHEQYWTGIVTGAGLNTENLLLRIAPAAVLTGRVLDEHGDPVRNAQVMVYKEDHSSGISRIRNFAGAQTDDQGAYEAIPLDQGTYFVSVKSTPWYAIHPVSSHEGAEGGPAVIDPSLDVAYPITYYGDATEASDATPIPIRGGDHLEADIHLNPVPALHLIFHVPSGASQVVWPELEKSSFDGTETVQAGGFQEVSEGVYELTGVPSGSYMVRMPDVSGQWKEPTELNLSGSQDLDSSRGNSISKIKFRVEVAGGAVPKQIQIGIRNSKGNVVVAVADEKGEVNFDDVVPGKYDVLAGAPDEVYSVARMSPKGGIASGQTLDVPAGASLEVAVSLTTAAVTVEGFANHAGKAAPGAMVVLVPKDPQANHDRFRRDQSDLDGSFRLPSVSPGTYTVIAIANGWDLDWAKPAVLAHYGRHGQTLVVGEKAKGTMRLPAPVEVETK